MGFKVFSKGSAPVPTVPAVTVQKKGLFSLNDAAYKLMGEPEAVHFLWDSDNSLIALKGVEVDDLNGYPVRRQNTKTGRGPVLVSGSMFARYIGLDTSQAKRWTPKVEDDMLIVDLKQEGALVISNRNRGKSAKEMDEE